MNNNEQSRKAAWQNRLKQAAEKDNARDRELLKEVVDIGRVYANGDSTYLSLKAAGYVKVSGGFVFPTRKGIESIKPYKKWIRRAGLLISPFVAAFFALTAESLFERIFF